VFDKAGAAGITPNLNTHGFVSNLYAPSQVSHSLQGWIH
jgi:hypothetical protein